MSTVVLTTTHIVECRGSIFRVFRQGFGFRVYRGDLRVPKGPKYQYSRM